MVRLNCKNGLNNKYLVNESWNKIPLALEAVECLQERFRGLFLLLNGDTFSQLPRDRIAGLEN
jgi:hypothetical protein